jgi:hypothetical protein
MGIPLPVEIIMSIQLFITNQLYLIIGNILLESIIEESLN